MWARARGRAAGVSRWGRPRRYGYRATRSGLGMYLFPSSAHVRPRSRPLTPDPPLLSRRAVTADPFSGSRGVGGGAPAASEPAGRIHFGPRAGPQAGVASDLGYPGKAFPAPSSRLSPQISFARRLEFDSGPGWPSLWSPGLPLAVTGNRALRSLGFGQKEGTRVRAAGPLGVLL